MSTEGREKFLLSFEIHLTLFWPSSRQSVKNESDTAKSHFLPNSKTNIKTNTSTSFRASKRNETGAEGDDKDAAAKVQPHVLEADD